MAKSTAKAARPAHTDQPAVERIECFGTLEELVFAQLSLRAFAPDPVPGVAIEKVLVAASAAPSAGNLQSYEVIVVTDPNRRADLSRAASHQTFISEAPIVFVFCADTVRCGEKYGARGSSFFAMQDATLAAAYAQLAITSLGYGSVWIGTFDETEVAALVGLAEDSGLRPVCMLPMGLPAEKAWPTPRRKIEEFTHHGIYRKKH